MSYKNKSELNKKLNQYSLYGFIISVVLVILVNLRFPEFKMIVRGIFWYYFLFWLFAMPIIQGALFGGISAFLFAKPIEFKKEKNKYFVYVGLHIIMLIIGLFIIHGYLLKE